MNTLQAAHDSIAAQIDQREVELETLRQSLEHLVMAMGINMGSGLTHQPVASFQRAQSSPVTIAEQVNIPAPAKRGPKPKNMQVQVATPAKRGRPPANQAIAVAAQPVKTSAQNEEVQAPRRGRPPGAKAAAAIVNELVENVPARRGRPPANKAVVVSATETPTSTTGRRGRPPGSKAAQIIEDGEVQAPARRGRPPGAKASAAANTGEVKVPGKRGRPPGNKNTTTVASHQAATPINGNLGVSKDLPDTGEDFWLDLVSSDRKGFDEIYDEAVHALGFLPTIQQQKKLNQRMAFTLKQLVKDHAVKQDGSGNSRVFYK
jgi:hypothetical protein